MGEGREERGSWCPRLATCCGVDTGLRWGGVGACSGGLEVQSHEAKVLGPTEWVIVEHCLSVCVFAALGEFYETIKKKGETAKKERAL